MLLELTTTHRPATDLGHLLHKRPGRVQTFSLSLGAAHVFYPEATDERCTAALLLDLDPLALVRRQGAGRRLDYVNDRPYVASSFLSVALAKVYGSALAGSGGSHQELADTAIPLSARLAAVPCRGGADLVARLFAPLGYEVTAEAEPLDPDEPAWGDSRYLTVELTRTCRLRELLEHLYVLVPVLDDDKHYYVGHDELEKLLRRGGEWLREHPESELIVRRYLRHRRRLTTEALDRLLDETGETPRDDDEERPERPQRLADARIGAVTAVLRAAGARSVLDVGCGDGKLLAALLADPAFTRVAGMDVASAALEAAARRLKLDRMGLAQRERITLFQSSLTYRDARLEGYDAAAAVEVVEHLDPWRLDAFAAVLFGAARPGTVVLTTPNVEHNVCYPGLEDGRLRHPDHRFEWTREQFRSWCEATGGTHGYAVRFLPVGVEDPEVGPPTQMAVFSR